MDITKQQSLGLRGVAIVIIVLHNIVHRMQSIECNEFSFHESFASFAWTHFVSMPYSVFVSYWGWLGVPLFVFLSGYGLECMGRQSLVRSLSSLGGRLVKLLLLMLPAYGVYLLLNHLIVRSPESINHALIQASFLANILNRPIEPGVYWYFGMAAQLYILHALILRHLGKKSLVAISIVALIVLTILSCYEVDFVMDTWLRKQCLGWLTCFTLGMLCRRTHFEWSLRIHPLALAVVFLLPMMAVSLSPYFWLLTELFCLALFLSCRATWLFTNRLSLWLGSISASIFVVHPIVRMMWLYWAPDHTDEWFVLGTSLALLLLTVLLSACYDRLYRTLLHLCHHT